MTGGVWCQHEESNLRPADYESAALPTELCRQLWCKGLALIALVTLLQPCGARSRTACLGAMIPASRHALLSVRTYSHIGERSVSNSSAFRYALFPGRNWCRHEVFNRHVGMDATAGPDPGIPPSTRHWLASRNRWRNCFPRASAAHSLHRKRYRERSGGIRPLRILLGAGERA